MTTADYPVEELPDDNEQFQQHSFNADISVVFTIKDDLAYIQAFLESIRAIEPGEIVAIVSGDQDDPTFRYLDSQHDVVAYPIYCNRGKGRNLAIEHSTAPYVLMVDADNRYDFSRMDFDAMKDDKIHVIRDWTHNNVSVIFALRETLTRRPFPQTQVHEDIGFIINNIDDVKLSRSYGLGIPLNNEAERTEAFPFWFPFIFRYPVWLRALDYPDDEIAELSKKRGILQFVATSCYLLARPIYHYLKKIRSVVDPTIAMEKEKEAKR